MRKLLILTSLLFLLISGCASRPENIKASYISHERYIENDCSQLVIQMSDARAELAKYSEMQNSKATSDAWGVFLILVPVSQLTGDYEADVAKWKGVVEAIETTQIKNKCKQPVKKQVEKADEEANIEL